jgi:hypothetical protein
MTDTVEGSSVLARGSFDFSFGALYTPLRRHFMVILYVCPEATVAERMIAHVAVPE